MPAKTFSDVLIIPKYSDITSRKEVDLTSDFGLFQLSLPVISANMKSVTGPKMAIEMYRNGGLGILHRFCSIEDAVRDYKEANECGDCVGVSIGAQEEDKKRFATLFEAGARIFCVDLANGFCKKMKDTLEWITINYFTKEICLIAGNVATGEGARALAEWGCHVIKVGVGSGKGCTTRRNVGVGVPQLYAIQSVYEEVCCMNPRPKIISDGGIKFGYYGDVSKALKYSDGVMLGSVFAGASESPGNVFRDEINQYYKVYQGSASGESKISNGQANEYVEGIALKIPFRGHVKHILREIKDGVQSAFSYTNSRNIDEFRKNCEFVEISDGGREESKL